MGGERGKLCWREARSWDVKASQVRERACGVISRLGLSESERPNVPRLAERY